MAAVLLFILLFPPLMLAHSITIGAASAWNGIAAKIPIYVSIWVIYGAMFIGFEYEMSTWSTTSDLLTHATVFALPGLILSSFLGWCHQRLSH